MTPRSILPLFLSVVLALFHAVHSDVSDEMNERIKQCSEATNMSKENIAALKDSFPDTPEAKCFVGCLMEKSGIMEDNYKLNMDGVKNYYGKIQLREEDKKIALELSETCQKLLQNKYGADKCQNAIMTLNCLKDEAEKRNIDPWKFRGH